jgi:hypothetical protein
MTGRAIAIVAALTLAAIPANAFAQATGEVGGPPTMGGLPFPPPKKKTFGPKARSEPVVIGAGFNTFGKVEIVGQDSAIGLCVFIDHPKRGTSEGSCGPVSLPKLIEANFFSWESRKRRSRSMTELSGFTQANVAAVGTVAHFHKARKRVAKRQPGIVAVPGPDVLARLHQATPFGYFVADYRGCLSAAKVRLNAFDAAGLLLGRSQTNLGFPAELRETFDPCDPGTGGAGFGIETGAGTAVARPSAPPGPSRIFATPGSAARFATAR